MPSLRPFKHARSGFTLLEMSVAIGIFSIIILMTTFGLSAFQRSTAKQAVDLELLSILSSAARRARLGLEDDAWGVYIPYDSSTRQTETIALFSGSSYATRTVANDQVFEINGDTVFSAVDFSGSAANTGNDHEIVFAKLSGSTTQYGSVTLTWFDQTETLTITADGIPIRTSL